MSEELADSEIALHAYVDGQLDSAERSRVEALIAADPLLTAKVGDWQRQNAALRRAFGALPDEPMPARGPSAGFSTGLFPFVARIAASLLLLAFGGIAGWLAHGYFEAPPEITLTQASDLVSNALAAHRIYAVEVRHPVEVTAREQDHLVRWLSKRVGVPLVAPDLEAQGFSLVGGRLLPDGARAAAQFMYENSQGQRITFYVAANPDNHDTSFRMAEADGINIFYWLDGPLGVAVAGPLARDDLMRLVRIAYEQIDRRLQAG